jgi:exopolysaccharide production protein ExoQ
MPASLAAILFVIGIVGLFLMDRDRETRVSSAIWLPVIWFVLGASRNVSQWLGTASFDSPDQVLEGNLLDRMILSGLIALGLAVLAARWQRTTTTLWRNVPLLLFFLYCAASVFWSDFPFVAFKRWTKVLGNVVMVLIILTDVNHEAAVKKFLSRSAFILIPLSVLFIRYFPEMGRYWDRWEGATYYSGVALDKNMLGCLCLVLGFGIVARFVESFREAGLLGRRSIAAGVVLAMTLWLLYIADSATSTVCFVVGSTLIVLSMLRGGRPAIVHLMVGGMIAVGSAALLVPSAFVFFVESLGRDPTLTGRTELWETLLDLNSSPWLGAGFESFFLGERLEILWMKYWWRPNQAHNGFLEVYLTLGVVGLCLLALLLATGYRRAIAIYRQDPLGGSLRLACIAVALAYNVTEAAFKVTHPVWIMLLLSVTAVAPVAGQVAEQNAPGAIPLDPRRNRHGALHPVTERRIKPGSTASVGRLRSTLANK